MAHAFSSDVCSEASDFEFIGSGKGEGDFKAGGLGLRGFGSADFVFLDFACPVVEQSVHPCAHLLMVHTMMITVPLCRGQ